ncbi:hypothetical protein VTN49DRAFT_4201 [Thermomyces lanuginosus]|uniref:uncharacterized protein n=1 Tax=Thermomyces lanuginosus TaxID=5541 RepID=UPI003744976C
MASLSFSLEPPALLRLHDALICLSKFNENVSLEAEYDQLRLSTLNSSKTAYASFVFDSTKFFSAYSFSLPRRGSGRFSCQLYLKALLSIFKGKAAESRDKDTAVERCDVRLHDSPGQAECRLIVKMICSQGVVKSYKLTYEPASVQHAIFDRTKTRNLWRIDSKILRELIEHFSPSSEELDIYSEKGKAILTSYTTKVADGKEILKQPVHTSVAIETKDFEEFLVKENVHVAINVKDFKAAVVHADSMKASITARYTRACRPLQLTHESDGVACEYTLMTRGDTGDEADESDSSQAVSQLSARSAARVEPANAPASARNQMPPPPSRTSMPPPAPRAAQPSPPKPEASFGTRPTYVDMDNALFVPADDDRQWDELNLDDENAEDSLRWDQSLEPGSHHTGPRRTIVDNMGDLLPGRQRNDNAADEHGIPPTQHISQVRGLGLFD